MSAESGLRSATVVVVGSVNVDLVVTTATLPGPGETVVGGQFSHGPGGKGGNQAAAAGRLGAQTFLVGNVGDDDYGRTARVDLTAAGVDTTWLGVDPTQATGIALILVANDGENLISVASGANSTVSPAQVRTALAGIAGDAVLLVGLEVPIAAVVAAVSAAHARGWPVVLNPAPAQPLPTELLALVDVLTPNQTEVDAVHLGGSAGILAVGCGSVVVTRGGAGITVHRPGVTDRVIPAFRVDAVDTTGAGDAFSAGLAWALAEGHDFDDALLLASAAGAIATTGAGARGAQLTRSAVFALAALG